jgi:serine/threonine protein kinase
MNRARPDPLVGADLGDFIVGEHLSSGGMARVYRGRQKPPIEAAVAIKFLHPHFAADPDVVASFRDEARTTGMLNHPNIVRVLIYGEFDGQPYLVMEFVDGRDLGSLVSARSGPLDMDLAIVLLRDVGLALEHAHKHNVIHRDVKPSNVLISRSGDVKLGDFGIARAAHASRHTIPGTLKGSIPYMSPEQARREKLDVQGGKVSDIFSMGILAYELFAGEHPFMGRDVDDVDEIIEAIQNHEPRDLAACDSSLPGGVVMLVHAMLVKDPSRRWDEVGKAVEVLEAGIQYLGGRAARDLVATYVRDPERTRPAVQRRPRRDNTVRIFKRLREQKEQKEQKKQKKREPWLPVALRAMTHPWRRGTRWLAVGATSLVAGVVALGIGVAFRGWPADPTITSLVPNTRTARSPEFKLAVIGAGFRRGGVVTWDGVDLATQFVSASLESVLVTQTLLESPGTVTVRARNPRGQVSDEQTFTIVSATQPSRSDSLSTTRPPVRSDTSSATRSLARSETHPQSTPRPADRFQRQYRINTRPGAATVYVDADPVGHEMAFDVKLSEGTHHFRVINQRLGIDLVLTYRVQRGDPAGKLLLDYAKQQIDALPSEGQSDE